MVDRIGELAARARGQLPAHVWHYFSAGARDGVSLAEAAPAWRELRFRPRVLAGVAEVTTATTLLGFPTSTPIGVSPMSLQGLAHPGGEVEMATGVAASGGVMVVSTNAGRRFSDIAATGVDWWLQIYLTQQRDRILPVLDAAVAAGAKALVLTVDTPFPGPKYDVDDADFGDLSGVWKTNHDVMVETTADLARTRPAAGLEHACDLSERDVSLLRDTYDVPVVVKGVVRADDAERAVDAGAAAVWVSNHGGRQLDRTITPVQALPAIVNRVAHRAEVYVDGGVESGLDVLAALGLGARAAFVGRPAMWALATGGAAAVADLLTGLRIDLAQSMHLAGCRDTSEPLPCGIINTSSDQQF